MVLTPYCRYRSAILSPTTYSSARRPRTMPSKRRSQSWHPTCSGSRSRTDGVILGRVRSELWSVKDEPAAPDEELSGWTSSPASSGRRSHRLERSQYRAEVRTGLDVGLKGQHPGRVCRNDIVDVGTGCSETIKVYPRGSGIRGCQQHAATRAHCHKHSRTEAC